MVAVLAVNAAIADQPDTKPAEREREAVAAPITPTPRSVAWWQACFDEAWSREKPESVQRAASGDAWQLYNLAYAIDGLAAMAEASGEVRYADEALELIESVIAQAKPSRTLEKSQFRDEYLGWASASHPSDRATDGKEVPLFESYFWRYGTRLLRVMRAQPEWIADATRRERVSAALRFVQRNVWDKWTNRGMDNIYRSRTHMASHWAFVALNLLPLMDEGPRRTQMRQVLDNICSHFPSSPSDSLRGQMRDHPTAPGGVFWSDVWGQDSRPGQDVSHGNAVVAFIIDAADAGEHFTRADVDRLCVTLTKAIWKPDGAAAMYVDGSGTGNGWINDGFCKLGRFDADIQRRLEEYKVGRGVQLYGNGAFNAARHAATSQAPLSNPAP